jgi:hypothetical protein
MKRIILCIVGVFAVFGGIPTIAYAQNAELFFTAAKTPLVGVTYPVVLKLKSTQQSANAISAVVTFQPNEMEVVSISRAGSVVNFWAAEPAFSNRDGVISFEGVVLNPGFQGESGILATMHIRPKKVGTLTLRYREGSVLANDGKATPLATTLGVLSRSVDLPPLPPPTKEQQKEAPPSVIPEKVVEYVRVFESYIPPSIIYTLVFLVLLVMFLLGGLLVLIYLRTHKPDRTWGRAFLDLRRHIRDLYVLEVRKGITDREKEVFKKVEKDIKDIERRQ